MRQTPSEIITGPLGGALDAEAIDRLITDGVVRVADGERENA